MSDDSLWLVGNVGAEESRAGPMHPHAVAVARLLALSLPGRGQLLLPDGELRRVSSFWPDALGDAPEDAAFAWLSAFQTHAWFPDAESDDLLRSHQRGPLEPSAAVVAAVHDKAFTERVCEAEGLTPPPLRGLSLGFQGRPGDSTSIPCGGPCPAWRRAAAPSSSPGSIANRTSPCSST
jgi:hypothetical protein